MSVILTSNSRPFRNLYIAAKVPETWQDCKKTKEIAEKIIFCESNILRCRAGRGENGHFSLNYRLNGRFILFLWFFELPKNFLKFFKIFSFFPLICTGAYDILESTFTIK